MYTKKMTFSFPKSFVAILLIMSILFISNSSGVLSFAWRVEPSLDRSEYSPGSQGTIEENVINTGQTILDIYQMAVMFDWQKDTGDSWFKDVDLEVALGERSYLGKLTFDIPDDVAPGRHTYEVGLRHRHLGLREGWVDDELQWSILTYEIFISEKKAAKLELLNMVQTPEAGEEFYIGDAGSVILTLENTGGLTAGQVKVELEETVGNIINVIETTAPKDLEPGSTAEWTLKVRAENPGNTSSKITLYMNEEIVDEFDYNIVVSEPNLEVVGRSQTPEEGTEIIPGDSLTYTLRIKNVGQSTVKDLEIEASLPSGLILVESSPPVDLEPEETETLFLKIKANSAGEYNPRIYFMKSEIPLRIYHTSIPIIVSEETAISEYMLVLVVAVVIGVVVGTLAVSRRRKKLKKPKVNYCPKCGGPVTSKDVFCENCGSRLQ